LFDDSLTWRKVIPVLARSHTVIAPDLFGHGESDAPPHADYSLGGHAGTLRDLLEVLGHHRVTIVGHSLGGGIAMSFAYRYPARVRRLGLISSGGFGREVHPLLRALSVPGAALALRLLTMRPTLGLLAWRSSLARKAGAHRSARKAQRLELLLTSLSDRGRRVASIRTLRSVIGFRGQCVSALHRLYALGRFPTLLVWGTRDRVIPAHHASAALAFKPGAELVLLDAVGHLPHLTRGEFVAACLSSFIDEAPARAPIVADSRAPGPSSARRPMPSPAAAAEASI
jgi:pimeloyl-ACP methyl ester carboxylesterase